MSKKNNIPMITAKLALEDIAQLTKERDELKAQLEKAYRAACHFMVCEICADCDLSCGEGEPHRMNLVECEPFIGIGKEARK